MSILTVAVPDPARNQKRPAADVGTADAIHSNYGQLHQRKTVKGFKRSSKTDPVKDRLLTESLSPDLQASDPWMAALFARRYREMAPCTPRGFRCQRGWCPRCAAHLSKTSIWAVSDAISARRVGAEHLIWIRLSAPSASLADGVRRIRAAFVALRRHPVWRGAVLGDASGFHLDLADDGRTWNLHVHVIVEVRDRASLSMPSLANAWQAILAARGMQGDEHVEDVRYLDRMKVGRRWAFNLAVYVAKKERGILSEMENRRLAEFLQFIPRQRLVARHGKWYGKRVAARSDPRAS